MPHPAVATPCDPGCTCSEGCVVCLAAEVCVPGLAPSYSPVGATFSLYGPLAGPDSPPVCTGPPLATGHADAGETVCLPVPAEGSYSLKTEPDSGSGAAGRCQVIFVACPTFDPITIQLPSDSAAIEITVGGCMNKPNVGGGGVPDGTWGPCPLEGWNVDWTDGTNSLSGTTTAGGQVRWEDVPIPEPGTPYAITLTKPAGLCGWADVTEITGFIGDGDLCGIVRNVTPDAATGWTCTAVCDHPLPETFTLTGGLAGAVALSFIGSFGDTSIWRGCGTYHCANVVEPVECPHETGDAPALWHGYAPVTGGATITVGYDLLLTRRDDCGPAVDVAVVKHYPAVASNFCDDPLDTTQRLTTGYWFLLNDGTTYESWPAVCGRWHYGGIGSIGSPGGVIGTTAAPSFESDWEDVTDFCACLPGFSGSVGSSFPCVGESFTIGP